MSYPKGGSSYRAEDDYVGEAFHRMATTSAKAVDPPSPGEIAMSVLRRELEASKITAKAARDRASSEMNTYDKHIQIAAKLERVLESFEHAAKSATITAPVTPDPVDAMDRDAFKEVWDAAWEAARKYAYGESQQKATLMVWNLRREDKFQHYMDSQLKAASDTNT